MAQILINSRMCAEGHRPICQDTGIVNVFVKIGMDVRWDRAATMTVEEMVNEGVRRAYLDPDNKLRASHARRPRRCAQEHQRQHPAVVVGSSKAARSKSSSPPKAEAPRLNQVRHAQPIRLRCRVGAQDRPHHGRRMVPSRHARHRHRRHAEKAMLLAKEALMDPIDMQDLIVRGPANRRKNCVSNSMTRSIALGIGAQGLGGLTTVLDVKILDYPTHAANLPVAMIPNCAATRHAHFVLDGSGPGDARPALARPTGQSSPMTSPGHAA